MILFKKTSDLRQYLDQQKREGLEVGFVPTMGALHSGHISLIKASKNVSDITVCSIFVNPTQFNDPGDFEKYPSTIEKDIFFLEKNKADVLFYPSVDEIYTHGAKNLEHYDLGYLETILEGEYRPGHFQGVCQVMSRLLKIVEPQHLFMGQKDYQQCMVVKKLIEMIKLKIIFHTCPTTREPDGLAMSSRNVRLNTEERKNAVAIFEALTYLKKNIANDNFDDLIAQAKNILQNNNFKIDYIEIADAETLQLKKSYNSNEKLVALAAAFQGQVRLIDNMLLNNEQK
jgi:pantoate--beta-alanine ligase